MIEKIVDEKQSYDRSLIEASLDPLVTISPEGKITDVNEASVKVTGAQIFNAILNWPPAVTYCISSGHRTYDSSSWNWPSLTFFRDNLL